MPAPRDVRALTGTGKCSALSIQLDTIYIEREGREMWVVRVGGDDGKLRPWNYIYVYSIIYADIII